MLLIQTLCSFDLVFANRRPRVIEGVTIYAFILATGLGELSLRYCARSFSFSNALWKANKTRKYFPKRSRSDTYIK